MTVTVLHHFGIWELGIQCVGSSSERVCVYSLDDDDDGNLVSEAGGGGGDRSSKKAGDVLYRRESHIDSAAKY